MDAIHWIANSELSKRDVQTKKSVPTNLRIIVTSAATSPRRWLPGPASAGPRDDPYDPTSSQRSWKNVFLGRNNLGWARVDQHFNQHVLYTWQSEVLEKCVGQQ